MSEGDRGRGRKRKRRNRRKKKSSLVIEETGEAYAHTACPSRECA